MQSKKINLKSKRTKQKKERKEIEIKKENHYVFVHKARKMKRGEIRCALVFVIKSKQRKKKESS